MFVIPNNSHITEKDKCLRRLNDPIMQNALKFPVMKLYGMEMETYLHIYG